MACGTAAAAPFAARMTEADPPTGATAAALADAARAEEPLARDNGIRWSIAPWRWAGSLTLDARWQRTDLERRSTNGLVIGDLDFASYVWQPWFIQLRGGVGLLLDKGRSQTADGPSEGTSGRGITARASASIFPASRFPMELRFDLGDTRSSGETLVNDYRTLRLGVSQGWRPATGSDTLQINLDHSRVRGTDGIGDRLSALRVSSVLQRGPHLVDLGLHWSQHQRDDTDDRTGQGLLSARHTWQDSGGLMVENLASWSDLRLRLGAGGARMRFDSQLAQLSTLLSWRPRAGSTWHDAQAPLVATAALLVQDSRQGEADGSSSARSISLAAGLNKEFSRTWRASAGLSLSQLQFATDATSADRQHTLTATVMHTPQARELGDWRWVPSASLNLSLGSAAEGGQRRAVGVQGSHALSRFWTPADGHSLSLSLSQSLGVLHAQPGQGFSQGLSHALGVYWQGGDDSAQSLASLSVSDSRTRATESGSYQFINLQINRRAQVSRYRSWSANLTLQASRSDAEQIDAFTGDTRRVSDGWQRYANGSISFETQRAFDVPRLRFTGLLVVQSQLSERRANGDLDAPLEQATESIEARLDWVVGRIDTRLSARVARIDGRTIAAIAARAVRRF